MDWRPSDGSRKTSKDATAEPWQVLMQHQRRPRDQLKAPLAPKTSFTSLSEVGGGGRREEQIYATESVLDLEPRDASSMITFPLATFTDMVKSLDLSESQFPHLESGHNNSHCDSVFCET